MKIIWFKWFCLLFFLISCSEGIKNGKIQYIKTFVDERMITCTTINKLYSSEQEVYSFRQISMDSGKAKSDSKYKSKQITSTISEQNWKKGKSHYFVYLDKSDVILVIYFKNVDETEFYIAKDKKFKKSICQIIENPNFILNILNERVPTMY